MKQIELEVHHIGYAVSDIEKAADAFRLLGYETDGSICDDTSRNVRILFMHLEALRIELISPLDVSKHSAVDEIIKSGNVGAPYHICYETKNLNDMVSALRQKRFRVITPPEPAPAINGRDVVFLYSKDIGLIELVEA
jgi:methylmalonyl-CoA/ethylmalonyl-CoA epimerase